jgi:hypothetical protein
MAEGLSGITPIGAQVQAPDVMGSLNNILGLMGKKQQLQLGAQELQQQALVTNAAKKKQAFYSALKPDEVSDSGGIVDPEKWRAMPEYQNAQNAKPEIDQAMFASQKDQIARKSEILKYSGEQRQQVGASMAPLTADDDVINGTPTGRAKIAAQWEKTKQIPGIDPGLVDTLHGMTTGLDNVQGEKMLPMLKHGLAFLGYVPQATTTSTGQIANRWGITGEVEAAPGKPEANLPSYTVAGKTTGETAAATAAAARVSEAQEAANRAPMIINSLEKARDVLDSDPSILRGVLTGKFKDFRSTMAGLFGWDTGTAANTNDLAKQLAFSGAMRSQQLGLGGTDAGRSLMNAASPNMEGDPKSLPKLLRQSIALEKYHTLVGNAKAGVTDPKKLAAIESQTRDPRLLDLMELKSTRNDQERDAFLKERKLTLGDMKTFRDELARSGIKVP